MRLMRSPIQEQIIVLQPMTESNQRSFAKSLGKWPESPLAASCSGGFTAVALVPTIGIVQTPRTIRRGWLDEAGARRGS